MLAGLLLVSVLAVMWSLLPLRTWAGKFDTWIYELGAWGFVAFWLFCVIGIVLLVPASVFAVAAGAAFGWEAIPIVATAATIGSACAFFIARHFITKNLKRLAESRPTSSAIYKAVSSGGWRIVFLIRLSPIMPFSILNYVLGATEIRFWPCICTTFVGIIPAVILYVYLGIFGKAVVAGTVFGTARLLLLIVGLLATFLVVLYIVRRARAELRLMGLGIV